MNTAGPAGLDCTRLRWARLELTGLDLGQPKQTQLGWARLGRALLSSAGLGPASAAEPGRAPQQFPGFG